ncbi:hypothetical protein K458DRAFT_402865 [Lentithecium fluviatile CBS 122367]|uniref:Zn(2)-C6 fungal-type domain-containing protein n=1 Tax=Lentithecium fluviatile CBS 122367 TaxID=1168545 RepID=A0A6G1J775_9PLEO|nr:hypothetical protein K458DRAFT_402865 [Lentithecium fluviatile CBS 122367]
MPKRSAGCFECRKRKVRCDETKPECSICVRRGTKCPGYRPTQSFIIHKFNNQTDRPAIIREDENRYRYSNQRGPEESEAADAKAGAVVRLQPGGVRLLQDAPMIRQVSPIAIERVQHIGTFLNLFLPKTEAITMPPPSALMLVLPSLPATSPALLAAVDALSAAQLAVNNRNYPLINRSRSLYGGALTQMLSAIQSPARAMEDDTLFATYLLTLYEVFVGISNGHGFFYHVQGLLHLVKLRGPKSFKTRLSMQIFHAIRYNSLSIGYHVRKGSMLDAPEWLAVTTQASREDPYVALLDVCICIPRILERTDKLSSAGATPSPADLDALIEDANALAARGYAWFTTFERNGPRYEKVPVEDMDGFLEICADKVFTPVFDFSTFGAGICYLIYWMSMLILQSNTFKLLRTHRQLEPRQLFMWDRELGGYADCICRAVPYNCRPVIGYVAKFGSLTPLMVARKYYEAKKAEKEGKWCESVYQEARVPGLYSTPISMEPLKAVQRLAQNSNRYL